VDKPDPLNPDKEPYNTFRFGAKQLDPATGNYDMGARDYDPGLNRFLSRDVFAGAFADFGLSTDPFTMNRYAFAGGNPLSRIEMDGHWGWSDIGHAALDVVGLVPVVGEVADLANAAWYAAEGNYADAALSAAGAIPFVGWGAAAAKGAKYAYKGIDAARSGSKGVDEAADVAGATRKSDAPSGKDPEAPKGGSGSKGDGGSGPAKQPAQPPKQPDPAPPKAPDCKGNSFTPETRVVMGDGSTKAIEDVRVGDLVLATDPETGQAGGRMVIALIVGEGDKDLVEVTVDTDTDGDNGDDTGTVTATDGHPFWVENQGAWVDAKNLRPGDMLRTSAGTWVQVTAVREFQRHQRVHNLTIADIHTYHVTTANTDTLVHNCGGAVVGHSSRCTRATGGPPTLKRGPKPLGTGAHNQKIADVAGKINDGVITGGGQVRPEIAIPTPGGFKNSRRPDILVQRPDGSMYGINVGKQRANGAPIKREAQALWDLEGVGLEMHFVPYN
jgi:RHS repeat-associated protein